MARKDLIQEREKLRAGLAARQAAREAEASAAGDGDAEIVVEYLPDDDKFHER